MDDFQTDEETGFVVEEVSKVIKELLCYIAAHPLLRTLAVARDRPYPLPQKSVEATIGKNTYQHSRVNHWSAGVVEQCLSQLSKMGKPFKYIVTCIIMQKNGAGLQTAGACFWDNSTDGSCAVRWENKSMYCIVSVFGLSI